MVHLNYAVFLYNQGDRRGAQKQFNSFETATKAQGNVEIDPEVTLPLSFSLHISKFYFHRCWNWAQNWGQHFRLENQWFGNRRQRQKLNLLLSHRLVCALTKLISQIVELPDEKSWSDQPRYGERGFSPSGILREGPSSCQGILWTVHWSKEERPSSLHQQARGPQTPSASLWGVG